MDSSIHFYVYSHVFILQDKRKVTRFFITLRDWNKNIIAFPDFHKYIRILEQFEMISAQNIVVEADQTPGQVSFHNFAELKQYMERGLSVYNTTTYTVDNIKQAEHLRIYY